MSGIVAFLPIKTLCFNFFNRELVNTKIKTPYRQMVMKFSTHYDTENPLTRSRGIERLHKLHMELVNAGEFVEEFKYNENNGGSAMDGIYSYT